MVLSPEQEQQIIEENMVKIYRAVDNFTARHSSDIARVPYDDFVQEVSMAFLLYIRKCESMDDIAVFPWYTAMNAMRNAVFAFQPMSCEKSPHRFNQIIHSMPVTVSSDVLVSSLTDVDGMSKHWVEDKETMLDFERFMDMYDEGTKRLASMRYGGMKLSEIAEQYGVDKSTVFRRIGRLAEEYHDYIDDPEQKGDKNGQ